MSKIKSKIKEQLKMNKQEIKIALMKMGYNPVHLGTIYIAEAINILVNSNINDVEINLEKDVYIELAKKYNRNMKTIKSDMIKATNKVSSQNVYNTNFKLTPKVAITLVLDELNSNEKIS